MIDLRFPNITASTPEGQITQIKSAMIQLTEQLNYAFNSISNGETMSSYAKKVEESSTSKEEGTNNTFSEIKALIIKSADIVEHICDEVETIFDKNEKYVASSDFGTYQLEQNAKMEALPDSLKTTFYTKEQIDDDLGKRIGELESTSLIKQGVLGYFPVGEYEGVRQYGIEIGQTVKNANGEVIYNKMAKLTADGLELFANPNSKTATAIFKHDTMYIANANISDTLQLGGYKITTTKGLSFKWAGRSE